MAWQSSEIAEIALKSGETRNFNVLIYVSSHKVRDQISHPYETTDITVAVWSVF
jgi:hypothetical protein